jgi:methionyl-tRNA synthetase
MVFGHGFVYKKNEATGVSERFSKTLGNVIEPLDIVTKFNVDAFRYFFLRECPFPSDGEFSWQRFADVFNGDLANNFGNLYSRLVTLITKNYGGTLPGTANRKPTPIAGTDFAATVNQVREHVEGCRYSVALELIWRQILDPANQYADQQAPWKLVKTDKDAAAKVLFDLLEPLRAATVLLKPFIPRSAETIYTSFNFAQPWDKVSYADAATVAAPTEDLRVLAQLEDGKVKPLFPRIA